MKPTQQRSDRSSLWLTGVLVSTALVGTVANVSVTVVISGLAKQFDIPLRSAAAAVLALNLSMAFVMPLAGMISVRLGLRETLMLFGAILGVSTLLLTFATDVEALALGRIGQGIGMAGTTPTAVHATRRLLDGVHRSKALGWWSAANGIGLAVGPVTGGLLFELAGWRLVPLPTILIAVSIILTAWRGVPSGLRMKGTVPLQGVILLSLIAGSTVALLSALSTDSWVLATGVGVALIILMLVSRWRNRVDAAFPTHWLLDPFVRRSSVGASIQMFANGMAQVTVPAWLLTREGVSVGVGGIVLLAMTITMTVMGPFSGARSHIPYNCWFRGGLALCAGGLLGLALASSHGSWWLAVPSLVLAGLGAGALLTPSFNTFSSTIAGGEGVGLAMYNVLRLAFFAVGGLVGATAVSFGAAWVAFLGGGIICSVGALQAIRLPIPNHADPDHPGGTPSAG